MPEAEIDHRLKGLGRAVWTGGLLGGFVSLVPFVNLLNLFFMFWLAVAGGVGVRQLLRQNEGIRAGDSLVVGALCGLVGGACFSLVTGAFLFSLTPERMRQIVARSRWLNASFEQDFASFLQSGRFKLTLLVFLCLFVVLAIVAGAAGGAAARQIFRKSESANGGAR